MALRTCMFAASAYGIHISLYLKHFVRFFDNKFFLGLKIMIKLKRA